MSGWTVALIIGVALGLIISPLMLLRDTAHLKWLHKDQATPGSDGETPPHASANSSKKPLD